MASPGSGSTTGPQRRNAGRVITATPPVKLDLVSHNTANVGQLARNEILARRMGVSETWVNHVSHIAGVSQ
jgi:hypothetical protein